MQLKDLYENFGTSSPEKQAEFIAQYRLRRSQDLEKIPSTTRKKTATSATPKVELSAEEKLLMKKLGLKVRDVMLLRASVTSEQEESSSDDVALLSDTTFDEEED